MHKVRSFGVLSVARTFGGLGAGLTLFVTIPIAAVLQTSREGFTAVFTPLHLLILIGSGVLWGVVYGVVGALLYNVVARWTGGSIEVKID